jgi:uncharacterized membrane protein YfcA
MTVPELVVVAVAGFLSGLIKNGVGVGGGVFLLPTLALVFPAKLALALGAPLLLASDVVGLRYYWKEWTERDKLIRLMSAALPGMLAGTALVSMIPAQEFKFGIGLFGTLYALFQLFPNFPPFALFKNRFVRATSIFADKQIYFFGALGGVASVVAHAGGLVWSLYLMNAIRDKRAFVAATVFIFLFSDGYKTLAFLFLGLLTPDSLLALLPAIPAVWAGSAIGNLANKRMREAVFRTLVLAVILLVSVKLCF